jgi:hypothetical protein
VPDVKNRDSYCCASNETSPLEIMMTLRFVVVLTVVAAFPVTATAQSDNPPVTVLKPTIADGTSGGTSRPFTPLHTYFMAATGCSDNNSGTGAASPWCTPNHNPGSPPGFPGFVCGDVIIAAPGTYTGRFRSHGTVSNCPSTSGGIDGGGGIYFAAVLCGGSDLEGCLVSGGNPAVQIGVCNGCSNTPAPTNWAYEGFKITANGRTNGWQVIGCGNSRPLTARVHH